MKNLFKNQNKNIKIILILTVFSLFGLLILYNSQYQRLKSDFISKKKSETDLIEKEVSVKFNYIHQLIRSIASFNQVRTIDRYGRSLSEDSKNSIRQLYRYAYMDVKLSEIYILPKSIDPDKKDPITGKNEEPILMFDDFIDESAAETSNSASPETVQGPELEEVEIHEYRLYKEQLEYLNQNYKNQSSIKNNLAPIVSGRPVITCDNTDFTEEHLKAGNDEPRNGLLFTTPVYNLQGQLHGAVSAVIRTKVFSEYLPEKYYSLNLKAHQVRLANNPSENLINFLSSSQIDSSDLIYSETRSLNIQDRDPWTLTAVADNNEFYQSRDLKNIKFIFALLALIIIFLGGSLGFYFHRLNIQKSNIQNITGVVQASVDSLVQISKTLKDNSFYISEVVSKQSTSFTEVAASSEELKSTLSLNLSSLEKLKLLTEESKKQCNKGCESTDSVVMSFEKISQSNKDFEKLFSSYDEKLDKVFNFLKQVEGKTKIINDIVFQMKLLSFNASVEAARAGEYGKGFSIVAEEVGKLAALSGQSSVEISKLMDESITETELIFSELKTSIADVLKQNAEKIKSGIQAGFISSTVMEQINENVQNVNETMAAIHNALVEQTAGIEQINTALNLSSDSTNRLNPITQQVSSLSVEIEGKSKNIEGQVIELKQVI